MQPWNILSEVLSGDLTYLKTPGEQRRLRLVRCRGVVTVSFRKWSLCGKAEQNNRRALNPSPPVCSHTPGLKWKRAILQFKSGMSSSRELLLSAAPQCDFCAHTGARGFPCRSVSLVRIDPLPQHLSSPLCSVAVIRALTIGHRPWQLCYFMDLLRFLPITTRQLPAIIGSHRVNCALMSAAEYEA